VIAVYATHGFYGVQPIGAVDRGGGWRPISVAAEYAARVLGSLVAGREFDVYFVWVVMKLGQYSNSACGLGGIAAIEPAGFTKRLSSACAAVIPASMASTLGRC